MKNLYCVAGSLLALVLLASKASGQVWDTAEFSIRHGENPVTLLVKDFDRENKAIPHGQSKSLRGTGAPGNDQVRAIVRTTLQADPNGLVITFVPSPTQVNMTSNPQAAGQEYPLGIGGRYTVVAGGGRPGGGGGPGSLPWSGTATALVDGTGDVTIGNVVRDVGLPYSVPLNGTREVSVVFSDELRNTQVTFSIEGNGGNNGTASIVGFVSA